MRFWRGGSRCGVGAESQGLRGWRCCDFDTLGTFVTGLRIGSVVDRSGFKMEADVLIFAAVPLGWMGVWPLLLRW